MKVQLICRVQNYLEKEGEPRTAEQIALEFGITFRQATLEILYEREHGAPIAADSRGYYIERDPDKLRLYAKRLKHRQRAIGETAKAILKTAQELENRKGGDCA